NINTDEPMKREHLRLLLTVILVNFGPVALIDESANVMSEMKAAALRESPKYATTLPARTMDAAIEEMRRSVAALTKFVEENYVTLQQHPNEHHGRGTFDSGAPGGGL